MAPKVDKHLNVDVYNSTRTVGALGEFISYVYMYVMCDVLHVMYVLIIDVGVRQNWDF